MSTTAEHNPSLKPAGRLIGLGGKLRAGKDVVGDYLAREHGFEKMGMSDALNEALQRIGPDGPWIRLDFDVYPVRPWERSVRRGKYFKGDFVRYRELLDAVGYVEAKRHQDVRAYLQGLGTEVGREMIGEDVWSEIARKKISRLLESGRSVAITATRFLNELDMVRSLGGLTVWIERPGEETSMGELSEHASENSVSAEDFDYVLMNDGTLDQLYRKIEKRLIVR